jgi:hypothetical protein
VSPSYSYAPQVRQIAERLIPEHHRDLIDNGDVRIEYLFRDEGAKRNGKTVWGTASKVGGRNAFLAVPKDEAPMSDPTDCDVEAFFVVEIAHDVWQVLSPKQRVALVDHELCHLVCALDDKGDIKLSLVGHDIEEFESIINRYGLFRPDLESFARSAADQLRLMSEDGRSWRDGDETGEIRSDDDTKVTITHTTPDGETQSVDTTLGTISNLADRMAR